MDFQATLKKVSLTGYEPFYKFNMKRIQGNWQISNKVPFLNESLTPVCFKSDKTVYWMSLG